MVSSREFSRGYSRFAVPRMLNPHRNGTAPPPCSIRAPGETFCAFFRGAES